MTAKPTIAVIGSGISGLGAAWLLREKYAVTLFEKDARLGGHTNTLDITSMGRTIAVDTGFIVLNDHNYPHFTAWLRHLAVPTDTSNMSFAVSAKAGAIEYGTRNLAEIFANRAWLQPQRWRMAWDLLRFYQGCKWRLRRGRVDPAITLGDFLQQGGYGKFFIDFHILPMTAAIWSIPAAQALAFPLQYFLQFCDHHRLLNLFKRPVWRTVRGGARQYIRAMLRDGKIQTILNAAITGITRQDGKIQIHRQHAATEIFDHLIMATHPGQALALLRDVTAEEKSALGQFRYAANTAYLHRDESFMPKNRRLWSSWNYLDRDMGGLCVTYWMNSLQNLPTLTSVLVTLNPPRPPDADKTYAKIDYAHPVYTHATLHGQAAIAALQGQRQTYFTGAWLGHGFHEDGLASAIRVAAKFDIDPPWPA
jgi:uncharacterized protein